MSRCFDYDVVVIGGGSAGIVSGVTAGALGLRVLLIEKTRMGGECLNTGCVPSKALIHAARAAFIMRRAADFGLTACSPSLEDARGVMAYVRASIGVVREADATEQLLRDQGVSIRLGSAHFTSPDTIILDGETIRAAHFILATGSSPAAPVIPGLREAGFVTNHDVFSLETVPASMVVIGGGPVGVELAQAFHRLGSKVTVIQRNDRLLPLEDAEISHELERLLRQEGLTIYTGIAEENVERAGAKKRVRFRTPDGETTVECDQILLAAGRRPNIDGLKLGAAGIRLGERGVEVDETLHTTGPRAWACGDITGLHPFSHMAEYDAKLVVRNLFLPGRQKADSRVVPWTTFTDPEVSHLGLTEEEARGRGLRYEVYRHPFDRDDRALVDGEGAGFVKILATRWGGKILGAHIIGPRAGELIQEFVVAMRHGLNIRDVADDVHVYPTLTVSSQRAAQRWYEARSKEPTVRSVTKLYLRAWRRFGR